MRNFTGSTRPAFLLPLLASFLIVQGTPVGTSVASAGAARSARGALPKLTKNRLSTPSSRGKAAEKTMADRVQGRLLEPGARNKGRVSRSKISSAGPTSGKAKSATKMGSKKKLTPLSQVELEKQNRRMAMEFKWPQKIAMLTASFAAGIYASIFLTSNYDPNAPATTEIRQEAEDVGGQVEIGGDRSPVRVTDQ